MKLSKLSGEFLKYMVRSYRENHERVFDFNVFKNLHPELDDDFISNALTLLNDDGFASVAFFDGVAYVTTLNVSSVRNAEENTLLKKGYEFAKEIKSWI